MESLCALRKYGSQYKRRYVKHGRKSVCVKMLIIGVRYAFNREGSTKNDNIDVNNSRLSFRSSCSFKIYMKWEELDNGHWKTTITNVIGEHNHLLGNPLESSEQRWLTIQSAVQSNGQTLEDLLTYIDKLLAYLTKPSVFKLFME